MPALNSLYQEFEGKVDMVTVYIEEAHALDEWPMGDGAPSSEFKGIMQPQSIPERAKAAQLLKDDLKYDVPVILDNMENEVRIKYACWPVRFYILDDEKVRYKAQPVEYRYSVPQFRDAIIALLEEKSAKGDDNERPLKQRRPNEA